MKKLSLLLTFPLTLSLALNLDEAIHLGLEKNFQLKESQEIIRQSIKDVDIQKSSFLPVIDISHSYSQKDTTASFQLKKDSTSSLKISYNLFNGFADYQQLQSAKHLSQASKFELDAYKQDIALQIKQEYISYLQNFMQKQTYEHAYKLFEKQFDDAQEKYNLGLLSKNKLLQIDVNRLDAKQTILQAQKDLQLSKKRLSNILGGEVIENIEEISIEQIQLPLYEEKDLENRSEIKNIKEQIKSLQATLHVQKSSYYPKLDISSSYNKYYENTTSTGMEIFPRDQASISLNANWRIYKGTENFDRIAIYKSKVAQMYNKLSQLRLDIKMQFDEALLNFELASANYETSKVALKQAEENYKLISIRFKEGLESTSEVIDANYLLANAKERYFNSYYQKFLAVETFKRVLEFPL